MFFSLLFICINRLMRASLWSRCLSESPCLSNVFFLEKKQLRGSVRVYNVNIPLEPVDAHKYIRTGFCCIAVLAEV